MFHVIVSTYSRFQSNLAGVARLMLQRVYSQRVIGYLTETEPLWGLHFSCYVLQVKRIQSYGAGAEMGRSCGYYPFAKTAAAWSAGWISILRIQRISNGKGTVCHKEELIGEKNEHIQKNSCPMLFDRHSSQNKQTGWNAQSDQKCIPIYSNMPTVLTWVGTPMHNTFHYTYIYVYI